VWKAFIQAYAKIVVMPAKKRDKYFRSKKARAVGPHLHSGVLQHAEQAYSFSAMLYNHLVLSDSLNIYVLNCTPNSTLSSNLNIYHPVRKSTPSHPVLSQLNPIYIFTLRFCKIYCKITLLICLKNCSFIVIEDIVLCFNSHTKTNTGLFETIVGVLTTCHTQYT
jgi:hypothetical protein